MTNFLIDTDKKAAEISIVDNNGDYAASNVEDALQEVSAGTTLDGRYLLEANNLSDLDTVATARTNLGLVAGGGGDIWVEKAGDTMIGVDATSFLEVQHADTTPVLSVDTLNGWVGIGTNAPSHPLTVNTVGQHGIRVDSNSNSYGLELQKASVITVMRPSVIGTSSAHSINIIVGNSTIITATVAGRVGVGVSGPSGKFHIKGSADDEQLIIQANATQTANVLEVQDSIGNKGISISGDTDELRFYEGANYVGLEAPALTGDQIWVLPDADGVEGAVLATDGSGNLQWDSNASEKAWAFTSPAGSSGSFFYGGYYDFASSDNDFSGGPTFGTANASYAAHFMIVLGAQTVDELTLRVTGTSIDDTATRTASDTQDIVIPNTTAVDSYFETSKKWIGQVTITVVSGTAKTCNYGFCKYWDNNNTDFKVKGAEAVWLAGANDAGINIQLLHHNATGWTFNAAAEPTFPTPIAALQTDHVTEYQAVNGENGAWKRTDLSQAVSGSGSEGVLFCVVTTANKAFELGSLLLRIVPN